MKTQKEKVTGKAKKPAAKSTAPKNPVASKRKAGPTEDEIREKAREIYYERMARGEHGTPEDDWHEAESILKGL